jgi:hypothetical protein
MLILLIEMMGFPYSLGANRYFIPSAVGASYSVKVLMRGVFLLVQFAYVYRFYCLISILR